MCFPGSRTHPVQLREPGPVIFVTGKAPKHQQQIVLLLIGGQEYLSSHRLILCKVLTNHNQKSLFYLHLH